MFTKLVNHTSRDSFSVKSMRPEQPSRNDESLAICHDGLAQLKPVAAYWQNPELGL